MRQRLEEALKDTADPQKQKRYKTILALPLKVLASLLYGRGVTEAGAALAFLFPEYSQFHSWRKLPDIETAVDRLRLAKQRGEKILIHGDYDADGITATALLVRALSALGLECTYYLPHRQEDGYGLSEAGIAQGAAAGCTLLLTVDCGVSDAAAVEQAKAFGMDVIITDHHLPPPQLPAALAIVNPKRTDARYPFPELAGVGIALKLAQALSPDEAIDSQWLQLAAVGTVADMTPLVDENRVIASLGLAEMNRCPLPGVAALAKAAGYEPGSLDAEAIAFGLAPRLNAAGRMDSPQPAAELLLATDELRAAQGAALLDKENQRRRRLEEGIYQQALVQAREQARQGRRLLVVHGQAWHAGVIGIIAAKLLQRYYRPTIVLCGKDELTGSARSVPEFDIHRALKAVSQYLQSFGGHPGAAGLTVAEAELGSFAAALEEYAHRAGVDALFTPSLPIDASLAPGDVSLELADTIALLRPFGVGNPEPTFAVKGYSAGAVSLVGAAKRHLCLGLDGEDRQRLWAIGFSKSHLVHNVDSGKPVAAAGAIAINHWQGSARVQLQLADVRPLTRPRLGARELVDRRGLGEPWLGELAERPGTVFIANTHWQARRLLGAQAATARVIVLPPGKCAEQANLADAEEAAFLDPGWNYEQLAGCIESLPSNCRLHFFGGAAPEAILLPNLQLLRLFYRAWQSTGPGAELLTLLPADLAEPLLLERALGIFAEAGLACGGENGWELTPRPDRVDLTKTATWRRYGKALATYKQWLQHFAAGELDALLA